MGKWRSEENAAVGLFEVSFVLGCESPPTHSLTSVTA